MQARPSFARVLCYNKSNTICFRCQRQLAKAPLPSYCRFSRRLLSTSLHYANRSAPPAHLGSTIRRGDYFSANGVIQELAKGGGRITRGGITRAQSTAAVDEPMLGSEPTKPFRATSVPENGDAVSTRAQRLSVQADIVPPRQRRRRKEDRDVDQDEAIPLDASNRLTTVGSRMPAHSIRRLLTVYLSLSKPRLTFLIVLTTTAAYSLYPVPSLLSTTATTTPSLSTLTLAFLTTGTFLTCASANALNMMLEPQHDAKMSRTRNRPLVRGLITKRGALIFALVTGLAGTAALYIGVNPTTSSLAASNIVLYAFVYTPLKRMSVLNTWVGALVGGIPPLMGWTAAAGQCATDTGDWKELLFGAGSAGGWLFAALLYAWQFPHFNALSWSIREEYKNAGYRMLAWTNTARNSRVALRYSILLFPICVGLSYAGVVEKSFVPLSFAANGWVLYEAVRFWRYEGLKGSARGLFWASVWHLPIVLVLAMVLKKGLWARVWTTAFDEGEWEEEWPEDDGLQVVNSGWEEKAG